MIENELQRYWLFTLASCATSSERFWHCAAGSIVCASQEAPSVPILPILKTSVLQSKRGGIKMGVHGQAPQVESWRAMLELELGDNRKRVVYGAAPNTRTFPVAGA